MIVAVARLALRRFRAQRGSATVELVSFIPLLGLCALAGWQMLLFAFSATAAENAARTGSRVESKGGQGEPAARESVSPYLRDGTEVRIEGTRSTVRIRVPIILPGLDSDALSVSETAELPVTED